MRKLTTDHLPMLRDLRNVYLKMIKDADRMKREEFDVGTYIAFGHVIEHLKKTCDRIGRDLTRLEHSPH